MVHEVAGDILLSEAKVIAHGVAPNDNFATGLALSLREQWPAMYKDFRHYCHNEHPEPGGIWTWPTADGRRIVNLFTQESAYGHGEKPGKATLPYVNHALADLARLLVDEGVESVAIPRIATGVGGLEWSDVQPLVTKHLGALKTTVFVYTTFRKGVKAEETTSRTR